MNPASAYTIRADEPDISAAPFAAWMDIETLATSQQQIQILLRPRDEMKNRQGTLHGGILASLLDIAMVRAARAQDGVLNVVGTVDLHVQFLAPGSEKIIATGHVEHRTRSTAFCRAKAVDGLGQLVAIASATIRLVSAESETG